MKVGVVGADHRNLHASGGDQSGQAQRTLSAKIDDVRARGFPETVKQTVTGQTHLNLRIVRQSHPAAVNLKSLGLIISARGGPNQTHLVVLAPQLSDELFKADRHSVDVRTKSIAYKADVHWSQPV